MLKYTKYYYIPTKPLLFFKTPNKTNAGRVSTILQEYITPQISYYVLIDLLYNIPKIDKQANKPIITHADIIICIYTCVCMCMCIHLCVYAYIDRMLVCMHVYMCMLNIK